MIFVATYKWYICLLQRVSLFLGGEPFMFMSQHNSVHCTTTPCFMHVLWKEKCTGIKVEYCFKL